MKDRDYTALGAKLGKDPVELETIFQYQVSNIDAHESNHLGLNRFTVKELKLIKKHFLPLKGSGILRLSGRKDESIHMLTRYFRTTKALQPLSCEFCFKKAQVGQTRCPEHEDMTRKPKNRAAVKPSSSHKTKASQNIQQAKHPQHRPVRSPAAVKRKRVSSPSTAAAAARSRSQSPYIPTNRYAQAQSQSRSGGYPHTSSSSHAFGGHAAATYPNAGHHPSVAPPTIEPLPANFDPYYHPYNAAQQAGAQRHGNGNGNGMSHPYSNAPFIPYGPFNGGYGYGASSTGQAGYAGAQGSSHPPIRTGDQHGGQRQETAHYRQGLTMEEIDEMEDSMIKSVLAISREESARQRQAPHATVGGMNPRIDYQGAKAPGYPSGMQAVSQVAPGANAAFHEPRSDAETKSEPLGWEELLPLHGNEEYDIKRFAKYGFSKVKVLQTLRKYGNNLQRTSLKLFQDFTDLQEAKQVDQAALLSERSGEEEAAKQKQQEKIRLEFGDVLDTGEFSGSVLISTILPQGFKDLLRTEKATDGTIVIDLEDEDASACRTLCIKLLVLEKRAFKWYKAEANDLFMEVAKKFNDVLAQGKEVDEAFIQKVLQDTEEALFRFPSAEGLKYAGKPIRANSAVEDGIEIISNGKSRVFGVLNVYMKIYVYIQ